RAERHAAHIFVVQLPIERMATTRNQLLLDLRARNIGASVHYAPLHTMPLYNEQRRHPRLPTAEHLENRILTLPISASMTERDAADVLVALEQCLVWKPPLGQEATPVVEPSHP